MNFRNDWFSRLTGFSERGPDEVRQRLTVRGEQLHSLENGRTFRCGRLDIISLAELRRLLANLSGPSDSSGSRLTCEEIVGDAQTLHADPSHSNAVFQVASQFNLLEMVSPAISPEAGVTIYQNDATQGPACAIACGAGTIFRNYFIELGSQIGQTDTVQVDCLSSIGTVLGNSGSRLWEMRNGYALPTRDGLVQINAKLEAMSDADLDDLRTKLKVGIQWNTEVTLANERSLAGDRQLVTQVYCSAMPVAYSGQSPTRWQPFASLVLDAAYEATFTAAVINHHQCGSPKLFLTLLGGGAFGNESRWITDAIERSCRRFARFPLDVKIVSFRRSNPEIRELVDRIESSQL
ncbi:hypothetical protein [Roseiconus lacunae]|uniref:FAD-binding PCMH-type domain-containing protein n=1 Tax=Roseiconus lacunae TaxID=2605694 RepID=A0ABT7PFW8_9BACT|nr:hypothetical protein [Roseiconus lacunae]MDM4015199.1 hypothetical protein [Roseiconus lacunae]